MTFKQTVAKAFSNQDARMVGKIAEYLRFKRGMNYEESFDHIQRICTDADVNIDLPTYDQLLMDSETIKGRS